MEEMKESQIRLEMFPKIQRKEEKLVFLLYIPSRSSTNAFHWPDLPSIEKARKSERRNSL